MSQSGGGSGGGTIKNILLVLLAVVLGFWGLKLAAWALKTALLVGAVGTVGYLGYRLVSSNLLSDDSDPEETPRLPAQSKPTARNDVLEPQKDIDQELEELKRRLDEEV